MLSYSRVVSSQHPFAPVIADSATQIHSKATKSITSGGGDVYPNNLDTFIMKRCMRTQRK